MLPRYLIVTLLSITLFNCSVYVFSKDLPNFVIILSDDQDKIITDLNVMNKTRKLLQEEGTTFSNAFTTSPICCPSRASLLTGLYQHNHHVWNNSVSGGCSSEEWQSVFENQTFATELNRIGYSTFYAGKYLNQYGSSATGGPKHIPPGWDQWIGLIGNSKYYNYSLSVNGIKYYYNKNYLTSVLRSYAKQFIAEQNVNKPFLMMIAPPAPHEPFTPERKYEGFFSGQQVPRTTPFNYAHNKDKHWLVKMKPSPLPDKIVTLVDEIYARRLETLLSVDDLVSSVVAQLRKMNFLNNTYIIYTSDNGYHLGQFSLPFDKRQLYEFDIRVPLIIRGPKIPRNKTSLKPVILQDIAATLLHKAGIENNSLDGKSLFPLHVLKRRTFLIEYQGEGRLNSSDFDCLHKDDSLYGCRKEVNCKCQDARNNSYSCLRIISSTENFIYCLFYDNLKFEEAYNLVEDPLQIKNIASNLNKKCKHRLLQLLQQLKSCMGPGCLKLKKSCKQLF